MCGWKLAEKTYMNKKTVREKYVLDPTETLDHATYLTAYYGSRSNALTYIGNPDAATTLFTDTMKSNILNDNEVYASTSASVTISGRWAEVAHKFVFDMSKFVKLPVVLKQIEYGWDGYSSTIGGFIFRLTPFGWKVVRTFLPPSDGAGAEWSETLTSLVGVIVNKKFTFGIDIHVSTTEPPVTITLYTDYVYVTVTYKITDLINTPVIKPKVIGVSGYES